MALQDRAIRAYQKGHKIKSRLLQPRGGMKAYILKRDGRTKKFTILAIFDYFNVEIDRFRNSEYMEFACQQNAEFTNGGATRGMREISEIATHIATVENVSGESVMRAIVNGDEFKPYYMDFQWRYYTRQLSDRFDPAANEEA